MGIGKKTYSAQEDGRRKWRSIIWIYAVATAVSIALALLYSISTPTTYTAETVLVDENTQTDVLVGLTESRKWFWEKDDWDKGINDIEVYAKQLDSREFAIEMSKTRLPGLGISYLEHVKKNHSHPWWYMREFENDDEEALKQISECIRYRVVAAKQTLTIQVSDPDPVAAARLTDSVSNHLQQFIASKRAILLKERCNYLEKVSNEAKNEFLARQKLYAEYYDSHQNSSTAQETSHLETLRKDKNEAHSTYSAINQQYLREKMQLERSPMPFYTIKRAAVPVSPSNPQYILNILSLLAVALMLTTLGVLYKYIDNSGRKIQFGDVFAPWFVTIGIWSAILAGLYLAADELYPLSDQFYICLSIWLIVFCSSSFMTFNFLPRLVQSVRTRLVTVPFNSLVFNFFFVISVAITPLYLYSILKIVSMFGTEDFMANIRILAVHGNESFGYLSLSYVLNQSLLIMALWRYPRIPLWKLLVVYCMTLMNAFAIMEKGMLFFIIIVTMFVSYEKRLLRMRSIMLSMAVVVVLFFVLNLSRATEESGYAEETTLLDFFVMYVLSPPVAFGTLSQDISLLPGSHTFQAIYKLLNAKGLGNFAIEDSRVQDFVFVPIPTNIYTIFQPFFEDFKYRGIAFFALLYGMFSGWMYRLYQNGNAVGKIIYTYLVFVLALQFYQENLILNLVQFSQFVFLTMLVQQRFIGFNINSKRA